MKTVYKASYEVPFYKASYEVPSRPWTLYRKYIFGSKEEMDAFTLHVQERGGVQKSFSVDHVIDLDEAIIDLNREIARFAAI